MATTNNRLEALKCSIACIQGNEKVESIVSRAETFLEFLDRRSSGGRVARKSGSDEAPEAAKGGRNSQAGSA
ncbi:MAG TPA: hypothetical protein VK973_07010 [Arenicellales bacterium]|nr:hypothetical protein [Arenicellales bacterium]